MEMNLQEIQRVLPHRYPFLMVDRITRCEPGRFADGIKCVTANESQFCGHFPDYPVMPGVLILEALAQTGAVALLSEDENRGRLVLFGGIREARFRRQVIPGDVLELHCEILRKRGKIGFGRAEAKVGGELAAEAELMFAIS